jgi:hypothetical protein
MDIPVCAAFFAERIGFVMGANLAPTGVSVLLSLRVLAKLH